MYLLLVLLREACMIPSSDIFRRRQTGKYIEL
jgi:hypothetical protein